jgi:hypothetical protein
MIRITYEKATTFLKLIFPFQSVTLQYKSKSIKILNFGNEWKPKNEFIADLGKPVKGCVPKVYVWGGVGEAHKSRSSLLISSL